MTKIWLTMIGSTAYTFNSDDYMTLRVKHRIKGNLIGCVPSHPRNSNFSGLPAIYSKCEVQLLVEKEIVVLLKKDGLSEVPTEADKLYYEEFCNNNRKEQHDSYVQKKLEHSTKIMDKIIKGKKNKLIKMGVKEEEMNLDPAIILQEERERVPKLTESNCQIQIPTEHPFSIVCSIVEFPIDQTLKYRVFRDFWETGKYITEGETFGGDFLIYPGDPNYFHASHIIHVLDNPILDTKLLITQGRLSVNVNKECIYAFLNEANEIVYQLMEWEGNTFYK